MRLLLDTHAVLWWLESNPRLSQRARRAITKGDMPVFVSAVSIWEIENKLRLGRLGLALGSSPDWGQTLAEQSWQPLALGPRHAALAGNFPQDHRDPADRFLAAQAHLEDLTLVTVDEAFAHFPVKTIW